ncbi:MAG: ribonuclease P protein component [Acidimicrobiia bacterium]|nr:ribonuclease P protein component [Acidimicrobiia bacterium]
MIWRIRDRRTFQELRRHGRRVRCGVVSMTVLLPSPAASEPPRLAFAVPRSVGPAVVRNRLRRRVRAHLSGVRGSNPERFPSGAWLVALSPAAATMAAADLLADVDRCLERCTTGVGR